MSFGRGLFGVGLFGADSDALPPTGPDGVSLVAPLRVIGCVGEVVLLRAGMRVKVVGAVALAAPLAIRITPPTVALVAHLGIAVFGRQQLVAPISISVSAPVVAPVVGEAPFVWGAQVVMGGVDVSARLTGQVQIDAEENAARIAHFSLAPAGAIVALASFARLPVSIALVRFNELGAQVGLYRLFTGVVDTPEYSPATRMLTFTCSDARQAKSAAMTRAQIDALIPAGLWSPFVFDRYATADQYLADRLSTTAGAVDGDAYGALAFTPWMGTLGRTFTEAKILDGTLRPRLAGAASARKTRLSITYRYPQAKVRGIAFRYQAPDLSVQLFTGIRALTRASLEGALSGSGASVAGPVVFYEYPTSTTVAGVGAVLASPEVAAALCLGGAAWLNRRYSRWIDETWTVQIGTEGTQTDESRVISVQWDTNSNDGRRLPSNAVTAFAEANRDGPLPYIPPRHGVGETVVDHVPDGQPDAVAFTLAYRCSVLSAARAVAESLRGSTLGFSVVLDPSITLRDYLQVDTDAAMGGGKVVKVSHRLDIDAGSAISDVELECVSAALPAVSAPVRPAVPNAIKAGSLHTTADTWIGGLLESRPWDETTMFGFSTNGITISSPAAPNWYPEQFSVHVPGIEDAAQGPVTVPPTCTLTAGSTTIEALTSTDGFAFDVSISGAGIPSGTKVLSVDATARTAVLSNPVTRTGIEQEVKLAVRQYIPRALVSYMPILTRNGPTVGA